MPAAVGDILWTDVLDLLAYWEDWPPVHEILRRVYKIKGKKPKPKKSGFSVEEIEAIKKIPHGLVKAN